jgi:hypothetical protein
LLAAAALAGQSSHGGDRVGSPSCAPRTAEFHRELDLASTLPASVPRWRFRDSFDQDPIAARWIYEMQDHSRVQIVSDLVRRGTGSAKFTLLPEDDHAGGNRSELKLYWDGALGVTTWCSWSVLIPTDYVDPPEAPGHQIIGQWHDRPPAGVEWADYESHTPLIAVKYVARDGQSAIQVTYGLDGINKKIVATQLIEKGRWIDLTFCIRWSMGANGFVEIWKDGQPITTFNGTDHKVYGPNMYNETPAYLKIGLYRAPGFTTTNSVYFDEVRVGRQFADLTAQ